MQGRRFFILERIGMETRRQAVIYARVSSQPQADVLSVSLETQIEGCERLAQERGYEIVGDETYKGRTAYTDVVSGKALDRRGLLAALDRVPAGGVLLVYDVDRLARADAAFTLVADMLFEAGAGIEAVRGGDLQTPQGKLLWGFKRVLSEAENDQRVERSMRGKHEHSKRGLFVSGKPPYGYDYLPKKDWKPGETNLTINHDQAETVRRIFDMYVAGNSLSRITRLLEAEGVPKLRDAQFWERTTIRYILRNPAYAGEATFARLSSTSRNGKIKTMLNDAWTVIPCPAIVDPVTFDKAQRILTSNRERKRCEPKHAYRLQGMLICAECGRAYTGNSNGHTPTYVHKRSAYGCFNATIGADKIERQVWAFVTHDLRDPNVIREALGATDQAIEAQYVKRQRLLNKYERQLVDLTQERANLVRLASKGTISEADYVAALGELAHETEDVEAMRDQVRYQLAATPSPAIVAEVERRIARILAVLDASQAEFTPDEKRKFMQELELVFVRAADGKIFAKGRFQDENKGVLLQSSSHRYQQQYPAFWIEVPPLPKRGKSNE